MCKYAYITKYMKTFRTMTLDEYFSGYRAFTREDVLEQLRCKVCEGYVASPGVLVTPTVIYSDTRSEGFFAVCSERCLSMFILQNL